MCFMLNSIEMSCKVIDSSENGAFANGHIWFIDCVDSTDFCIIQLTLSPSGLFFSLIVDNNVD